MRYHRTRGFTLVELSIVIIIVGLIVAGVLGGQRMIDQARLRTVIGDKVDVETALTNFRNEFNALPGDYRSANDYWAAGGGCGDATDIDGAEDCNGNGNRRIDFHATLEATDESSTAWVHLGNSGHYPGAYSGTADQANSVVGQELPQATFGRNVGISLVHSTGATFGGSAATNANMIIIGATDAVGLDDTPFFEARDARSIDDKIDDGLATTGAIRGIDGSGTSCIDGTAYDVDAVITSILADGCAIAIDSGH